MRISKLYMPAVAMAGALALAACGGGDNMSGEGDGDEENVRTPAAGSGGYTRVTVTGGFTLDDRDEDDAGTLRRGDEAYFGAEGTGVVVTCPMTATNGCAWRIDDGILMVTGGAEQGKLWEKPAVPVAAGNTAQPTNTSDPLSDAVLVEALKGTGSVPTPWSGEDGSFDAAKTGSANPYTYPGTNPKRKIELTVEAAGKDIYWGHWHRYTEGAVNPGDPEQRTGVERGVVAGGAKHYDAKPDADVADATYSGNVHLYYKSGKNGKWTDGASGATVTLNADFGSGMIDGKVMNVAGASGTAITVGTGTGEITVPTGADYSEIVLGITAIGDKGTFGGSNATFKKGNNQSGSWEGKFYNDNATADTRAVHTDKAPDYAAGTFSVTNSTRVAPDTEDNRNALNDAPAGFVHDLTVHGAFGG